jgi:DNA-binding winged helix-turn-helix (wHTH) protein/Tfp pilus assembly protein PilF
MSSRLVNHHYEFGPFSVDPRDRLLLRDKRLLPLPPKVFDTLAVFVEHSGDLLEKNELLNRVWPDSIVEEGNLTQAVYALRKVLGRGPDGRPYIETIPRRGYRFVADVRKVEPGEASLLVRSLAVLPFRSLGPEADQYLQIGMANAMITKLSNIPQITVRPTSVVLKYAGHQSDPLTIGRELGVDSLLEGTIERFEDRIRVTVQLLRLRDGAPLWGEMIEEQFTNIFAVEDSISEQVTRVLKVKLSGEEKKKLTKRYTENVKAYQLYLRGRCLLDKRVELEMNKSISYFNQAIELDPEYALAYSGLAHANFLLGVYRSCPPKDAFPKAQAAAERALEIDDQLVEARACLAYMKACYDWNWLEAEKDFRLALELNPNYATGHIWYSDYLSAVGRFDEALAEVDLALELDSLSLINNLNLALHLYFGRQYDRAIEQLQRTLELDPYYALARWSLGRTYTQQARYQEAIDEFRKAVHLSGRSPLTLAALAHVYALSGQSDKATKLLHELENRSTDRYVSPYDIATIHAGLGAEDLAFEWLDRAYEERSGRLFFLKVDPYWDGLRKDVRFTKLLESVGLTQ